MARAGGISYVGHQISWLIWSCVNVNNLLDNVHNTLQFDYHKTAIYNHYTICFICIIGCISGRLCKWNGDSKLNTLLETF